MDFYKNPIDSYIPGGCPIFNSAVEADDHFPVIKQKVAATLLAGQESLIRILHQGIDAGEFSAELHPTRFAFKLVAAIEGATVLCRTMETSQADAGTDQRPESGTGPIFQLFSCLKIDQKVYLFHRMCHSQAINK